MWRAHRKGANVKDTHEHNSRPRSVYFILFGGVAALVVLLFVIFLSSDRSLPDQPICSTVPIDTAQAAVLEGRIRGITIAYDDTAEPPSAANWGPVLVRLTYNDGQCANLPQGISQQDRLYQLIGAIQVYNDITENQMVEIKYDRTTALDESLYFTPTPIPTNTPIPTRVVETTPTPTRVATGTVEVDIVGPILPAGTPVGSEASTNEDAP